MTHVFIYLFMALAYRTRPVNGVIPEIDIIDLGFSTRLENALIAGRIYTLRDLLNRKRDDVLLLPGIGETSIVQIEGVLKKMNLRFES